jgi:hypothetical protein
MQQGVKLQLRLPQDIKKWLEEDSLKNDRSMNRQVVAVLRERMSMQMPKQQREEPAQQ